MSSTDGKRSYWPSYLGVNISNGNLHLELGSGINRKFCRMLICCIFALCFVAPSMAQPAPTDLTRIKWFYDPHPEVSAVFVGHSQRGFIENAKLSGTKNEFSVQLVTYLGAQSATWKVFINSAPNVEAGPNAQEIYSRTNELLQPQYMWIPWILTPLPVFMISDSESFRFATTKFADGSPLYIRVVANVHFDYVGSYGPVSFDLEYHEEFQFQAYNKLQLLATTVDVNGASDSFIFLKSGAFVNKAAEILGPSHTTIPSSTDAHTETKPLFLAKVRDATAVALVTHGHSLAIMPSTWNPATPEFIMFGQDIQPQVLSKAGANIPGYNFLFFYCCGVFSQSGYMAAAYQVPLIPGGSPSNRIACGFAMDVIPIAYTDKEWAGDLNDKGLPCDSNNDPLPGIGISTHLDELLFVIKNGYTKDNVYQIGTVGNGIAYVNSRYKLPGRDSNSDSTLYTQTPMVSVGDPHTRIWNVYLGNYTPGQLGLPNTPESLNRWYLHLSP